MFNSNNNNLNSIREIQKRKYEDHSKKEKIKKLETFLEQLEQFDIKIQVFKKEFFDNFSKIEVTEEIQKSLEKIKKQADLLVTEQILKELNVNPYFQQLNSYLGKLLNERFKLSDHCYAEFVTPLIDRFASFKSLIKRYYEKQKKQIEHTDLNSNNNNVEKDSSISEIEINRVDSIPQISTNRIRTPQHVLLQKLKGKNEVTVPSLDKAFRRAAAFYTPEDLDDLLAYGAGINSFDDKKKLTALLLAVIYNKIANVYYLLGKHADQKLADIDGHTPAWHAKNSNNEKLKEIFAETRASIWEQIDLVAKILSFLPIRYIYQNKAVSSSWKKAIQRLLTIKLNEIDASNGNQTFNKLPNYLQYIIFKFLLENRSVLVIKELFRILKYSETEKRQHLNLITPMSSGNVYFSRHNVTPFSRFSLDQLDIAVTLHTLKILPEYFIRSEIYSFYGALILAENLLTLKQIQLFTHSGSSNGAHDNLSSLLCKDGFLALQEGLISADQAPYISDLRSLLSKNSLIALREKLITIEQIKKIYHSGSMRGPFDNLKWLMTKNGLMLLRLGYVTPEQIPYISALQILIKDEVILLFEKKLISLKDYTKEKLATSPLFINLTSVCSNKESLQILEEGLITQTHLELINNISFLLSKNGLMALRQGLIKPDDVIHITDSVNCFSDQGLQALREGVLTIKQAQKYKDLKILTIPNGIQALKEGLITFDQCQLFDKHSRSLFSLLNNLQVLREKLITPEQAAKFYHSGSCYGPHDNLHELLCTNGIIALKEKLIEPLQVISVFLLNNLFGDNFKKIFLAIKLGYITIEDFNYGGKYAYPNSTLKKDLKEFLFIYNSSKEKENKYVEATITIQKHWRGKLARKKFTLFKDLQSCMKSGNIHYIEKMLKTKKLIDQNKLQEASSELTNIKVCLSR